jgi:hypothetical protein
MHNMKTMRACAIGAILLAAAMPAAQAATSVINWLNLDPVTPGFSLPPGSYTLPGYGTVLVTIGGSPLGHIRQQSPLYQNGSVTHGGDVYSWTVMDNVFQVNTDFSGTIASYQITFTFQNGPVAAGDLTLAAWGLGRTDLVFPGNITSISSSHDATFLGDYVLAANYAPTGFTGGVGSFTLQNSLPGNLTPGNPAFNTHLGVVRIDDSISSLTLLVNHIGQDGMGLNIGLITEPVPEPGSAALSLLAAGALLRRRRP